MPSLQSIVLLAIAGTATAYPWTENHVVRSFEDELSGPDLVSRDIAKLLYERHPLKESNNLVEHYARDFDEPYVEGQVLIRSAKIGGRPRGSSSGSGSKGSDTKVSGLKPSSGKHNPKPSASSIFKGVKGVAGIIGDVGTGIDAATNLAGAFGIGKGGNGGNANANATAGTAPQQQRRDLEGLYNDAVLFARAARREHTRKSQGHGLQRYPVSAHGEIHGEGRYNTARPNGGHGPSLNRHRQPFNPATLKALENGVAGGSEILGLIPESGANSNSRRDLEDLLDDALEIYARALDIEDAEY